MSNEAKRRKEREKAVEGLTVEERITILEQKLDALETSDE